MDQIEEKLSRIFRYMGIQKEQLRSDASFAEDFEFNEFQFNCLILYIRNYFELNIKASDYTKLKTVGSTIDFIKSKKNIQIAV